MSTWDEVGLYDIIGPLDDPLVVLPGQPPPVLKVDVADRWPFDGDVKDEGGDDEGRNDG